MSSNLTETEPGHPGTLFSQRYMDKKVHRPALPPWGRSVLFQKKQGIKFDLEAVQRAVIYCLVKNTLSIDRRYLRKLLVTTTKPGEWYKWTLYPGNGISGH